MFTVTNLNMMLIAYVPAAVMLIICRQSCTKIVSITFFSGALNSPNNDNMQNCQVSSLQIRDFSSI